MAKPIPNFTALAAYFLPPYLKERILLSDRPANDTAATAETTDKC
jgi:hypothetical protein